MGVYGTRVTKVPETSNPHTIEDLKINLWPDQEIHFVASYKLRVLHMH